MNLVSGSSVVVGVGEEEVDSYVLLFERLLIIILRLGEDF